MNVPMASGPSQGRLVVISGPSASGKTTVVGRVLKECTVPLQFSVSATTRRPREGEKDGVNYHFLTVDEFARRKAAGEFLECFEVYGRGYWYGTLWSEVTTGLSAGKWVVLEIDVQGTKAVLERFPEAITIFVDPGSMEELERRLRARNTETEEEITRRLAAARAELSAAGIYRYRVTNDDPVKAAARICEILNQAR
jgi:guanylate kinase